ncbi:MAG: hypothetical protein VX642_00125 [Bdellovibrionota bacterium]|nr:hypothetical protein [Bdellovibrionota bacterium]
MKIIITVVLNLSFLFSGPSLLASSNWQELQLKKSFTRVFNSIHSEKDLKIKRNRIRDFISDIENTLEKFESEDVQYLELKSKLASYNEIVIQTEDHELDDLVSFILG